MNPDDTLDEDDEAWTMALCVRCASLFPARLERCPHCADLTVTVRNQAPDEDVPADWSCKITGADGVTILRLDHSPDAAYSLRKAHEFLRHYVAHRRRAGKR